MERFAKIFEGNGHQVLVKKEVDQKDDEFSLSATLSHLGNQFKNTYGYTSKEDRDGQFDEFDHEMAMEFIKTMSGFINMANDG